MKTDIVICHANADLALAQEIARALRARGFDVECVSRPDQARLTACIALRLHTQSGGPGVLAVTRAVTADAWLEVVAGDAAFRTVFLAPGLVQRWRARLARRLWRLPTETRTDPPVMLNPAEDRPLAPLIERVQGVLLALRPADPFASRESDRTMIRSSRVPRYAPPGSGASPTANDDPLIDPFQRGAPPAAGADWELMILGSGGEPAAAPEPVWLCASAPRQAPPGAAFTACLAAYVAAARASVLERLAELGEPGDRVVSDLAPDGLAHWRTGTPVVVRAAGAHLTVQPAERHFEWNGCANVLAFAVDIASDAPPGALTLCFDVEVAGLPMAFIALRVAVGRDTAAAGAAPPVETRTPRSVFASYSSKDAAAVTQRLSTLIRWSPGLDIFQDCLDLRPNESWKPQLAAQIRQRDAFVLFWSRHAAASPWVQWEYETARDAKGLAAILPMPLEDPALAPPPPEFADMHWRDRFMLAGCALAAVQAAQSRP